MFNPEIEIKTEVINDGLQQKDPLETSNINEMRLDYVFHEDVRIKEEPELDIIETLKYETDEIKKSPNHTTRLESDPLNEEGISECTPESTVVGSPPKKMLKCEEPDDVIADAFLREFLAVAKKKRFNSLLTRHFFNVNNLMDLSLHRLILRFESDGNIKDVNKFLVFVNRMITDEMVVEIEEYTREGSNELWNELRYARITDSKIFYASRPSTDGNLVPSLLGVRKPQHTKLINNVINVIKNKMNVEVNKCGLFLSKDHPMMAAAPDAINDDFVFKIKSTDNLEKYVQNGKINIRYLCQLQMEAHFAKRKKAMLCVAPHNFETSNNLNVYIVTYNQIFFNNILVEAHRFWKNNVFEKLWETV